MTDWLLEKISTNIRSHTDQTLINILFLSLKQRCDWTAWYSFIIDCYVCTKLIGKGGLGFRTPFLSLDASEVKCEAFHIERFKKNVCLFFVLLK